MQVETAVFLMWAVLPLLAYFGGRLVLMRTEHKRGSRSAPDAEQRLAQLRRWRDENQVAPRGRMADALRLAQGADETSVQQARQL
ncbi:hypothetical protein BJY20_002429 [Janibacter cremeus]|uniref:Uncharacterized protein n=1 Tax=Janibacter cremeus TaxID=1285192 RepID=A0A852VPS5_9MICO|nr:hypothetical protein [Janibacter cremeus]